MKTMKKIGLVAVFGLLLLSTFSYAQDEKVYTITVTKMHWNMHLKDFSMDQWKAGEKEFLDKVTKKNEFIVSYEVLLHYFTEDNSEILLVTTYNSFDDIEKASKKTDELVKAAWPDEKVRKAYFEKLDSYYANNHSDEIYQSFKGAKLPKTNFDKEVLYYVRVSHFASPKDGTQKEFDELRNKHLENVFYKNEFIKAYYPNVHAWGQDNTQFTEVFVVENLSDLEKSLNKNTELFKELFKDETSRKDYNDKMGKYFTGIHGDYIYKLVPELVK